MSPITVAVLTVSLYISLVGYNNYVSNPEESITAGENTMRGKTTNQGKDNIQEENNKQDVNNMQEGNIEQDGNNIQDQDGTNQASLTELCGDDIVCIDPHTICLDVCVCDEEYVAHNGSCVLPALLTQQCGDGKVCVESNTICSDICICDERYEAIEGNCLFQALLNETCGDGIVCVDSHTICSDVCVCDEGYGASNGSCLPSALLNETCGEGIVCVDSYTICSDVCVCDEEYVAINGSCFLSASLNEECGDGKVCVDSNTICSDVCVCDEGYSPHRGRCVRPAGLYEVCGSSAVCTDPNTYCSGNMCWCSGESMAINGKCTNEVRIGESCTDDGYTKCIDIRHDSSLTVCSENVCACVEGYVALDGGGVGLECFPLVPLGGNCAHQEQCNETCSLDSECASEVPLSTCEDNNYQRGYCDCVSYYFNAFGICYRIARGHNQEVTFAEGQEKCVAMDGDLLTLSSEVVALFIMSFVQDHTLPDTKYWIGLHQEGDVHKWMTNETLQDSDYQPWNSTAESDLNNDEQCVIINVANDPPTLEDYPCDATFQPFCMVPFSGIEP